ncbi:hypothetical protein [Vibrio owensii]|uniref:hypothetical protein n=1 Tax=Vibrio harveyi group TaxID=717610 RepID=UPI003CC60DF1
MSGMVRWKNNSGKLSLYHIQNGIGSHTLCGKEIPDSRKEWNLFAQAECSRCIKAQEKLDLEE